MARTVLKIVLTLAISIVLLGFALSPQQGSIAAGFGEGIRLLFLFMDIGIGVWIVLLVIWAARRRLVSVRLTLLFAAIGVLANFLTVTVVGLVQHGGSPPFMLWAAEAGVAFLVAAVIAGLIIRPLQSTRNSH